MSTTAWNLKMVKAIEAQKRLPMHQNDPSKIDWDDIEVGHIDTGTSRHPVFGPWSGNKHGFIRAHEGINYYYDVDDPEDEKSIPVDPKIGHGTGTSSILCGLPTGNFCGVAPGLPIVPYRAVKVVVLYAKKHRKRVAHAIYDASLKKGCEVISISLGFPFLGFSPFATRFMGKAVDAAYKNGTIIVAAGGQFVEGVTYPGKFSRTIGVGGVTKERKVWFENTNWMAERKLDTWAPSHKVSRAIYKEGDPKPYKFKAGDGTSFGTAHVAAAAAMWLRLHRDEIAIRYSANPWQRVEAFRYILRRTGSPISGDVWPNKPVGILDIDALLSSSLPDASILKKRKPAAKERH